MRSFPWDSLVVSMGDDGFPIYDRNYEASDLREVYQTFFSNGVFLDTSDAFQVTPGEGMNVLVATGKCCINGTIGYESSTRTLALQASSSQDRIDTVVLRWNANVETRSIDLYVKTGVAAATPTAPTLTRSETVYELGLADIFVVKNSGAVSASRITDTRLNTSRCGVVTPFASINTESFYETLNAALQELEDKLEEQTQRAVDLAQDAIDGTVAGNLQSQIDGKVSKAGDTMTGDLKIVSSGFEQEDSYQDDDGSDFTQHFKLVNSKNGPYLSFLKNNSDINRIQFYKTSTELGKPLLVGSGGTGASDATNARMNLEAMRGVYGGPNNTYIGMGYPNGNTSEWIRTPETGLIPYTNGGASSLGTAGWYFNNAYIKYIHPLGSSSYMSDFIISSSAGSVTTGTWAKYIKFNSGYKIVYLYRSMTATGTKTWFRVDYPFAITDAFIGGATVSQSGNTDCYIGNIHREGTTWLEGYVLSAFSGQGLVICVTIMGS